MKKIAIILLITTSLLISACATSKKCDAYGDARTSQQDTTTTSA